MFAWGPILPLCLSPVIRIDAGATFADTLGIFGGFPGTNFSPKFQMADSEGLYRIVVEAALSSYDEDARPFGPTIPWVCVGRGSYRPPFVTTS